MPETLHEGDVRLDVRAPVRDLPDPMEKESGERNLTAKLPGPMVAWR